MLKDKDGKLNLNMIEFLIGKIAEADLTEENKAALEDERAIRQAHLLLGDVPLKEWDPADDEEEEAE